MRTTNHSPTADFTRTRWSMVRRLRTPDLEAAGDTLAELALRYWYPVYAYVRRCGHAPGIAQDITRAFFQQIGQAGGAEAPFPRGRFRDWLLERLTAFLADDWRELARADPSVATPALDELEQRNRRDHASAESPERAFHRSFAREVLARGFVALRQEARQTGHIDMYEALEPYLARDPAPGRYQEMAQGLDVRPLALVLALKRLRQRFRELVQQELADTVTSAADQDVEQRSLHAALRGGGLTWPT